MEVDSVRALIREKLRDGRLPAEHISRFWSGPSEGEECDACDKLITSPLVVEGISSFVGGRKSIQMHVSCFALWDEERSQIQP
jgi:hypothetical protein